MYSLILHGRKSLELQKWRNLRFAVNLLGNESAFTVNPKPNVLSCLSNSFSSASGGVSDVNPLQDGVKGQNFTVSYLVDSLGFTTKLAQLISRKVSLEDKGNPDSVLSLLRRHGFTNSQISTIITDYPQLLISDAEKSLAPKLNSLQSRGASASEVSEIVSKVPKILGKRQGRSISLYYEFVKDIIEADKSCREYEKSCHSLPEGKWANKIRNVLVLRDLGMPQKRLFPLLISVPQTVCGKEKFEESLKKVVGMGFDPTTSKFVEALRMLYQMSDKTIEEKVQVYKSVGFTVDDIWEIFKKSPTFLKVSKNKILSSMETFVGLGFSRDEFTMMVKLYPKCIGKSAETVKKKTEFVVKKMNWSLKTVVSNPAVFGYNLEKRIVPRCNVIKTLMTKALIGSELPAMSRVLAITDEAFLNRFVREHDDKELVAELVSILTRGRESYSS